MEEPRTFETVKVEGGRLAERIGRLIEEGNVRRIVVRQGDEVIAEFPLTVGVVGALIAPIAAAIGALAALIANCRIEIERSGLALPERAEPQPPQTLEEAEAATMDELVESWGG